MRKKAIIKAIEKANKAINGIHTELEFSIHEKSKQGSYKGDTAGENIGYGSGNAGNGRNHSE